MSRLPLLTLLMLALLSTACGATHKPVDPGPRGTLRFKCTPDTTLVEVDETSLGPAHMFEENGLLLRPGEHRVVLRATDHFAEYKIVEIIEGQVIVVEVDLREVPD